MRELSAEARIHLYARSSFRAEPGDRLLAYRGVLRRSAFATDRRRSILGTLTVHPF